MTQCDESFAMCAFPDGTAGRCVADAHDGLFCHGRIFYCLDFVIDRIEQLPPVRARHPAVLAGVHVCKDEFSAWALNLHVGLSGIKKGTRCINGCLVLSIAFR